MARRPDSRTLALRPPLEWRPACLRNGPVASHDSRDAGIHALVRQTPGVDASWRDAITAPRHCLTGCAIGEVLGMVIATAAGWGNLASIVVSTALAFFFGYLLTFTGVRRAGLSVPDAV